MHVSHTSYPLRATRSPAPSTLRRIAPWGVTLALTASLLVGALSNVLAQTGESFAEAIYVAPEGRFTGTVGPQKSLYYRFNYNGGEPATITVSYEPSDSSRLDFQLYTGTADTPRPEGSTPTRSGNMLTQTFTDASARDVFIQVVNNHTDRDVSFVGTITPSSALATPTPVATGTAITTPTPAPAADNPQAAITVGQDGTFNGAIGTRRAVWHRFYYGNPGAEASVSVEFAPNADTADLNLYTGPDQANLTQQGGSAERSGNTLTRRVNLPSAQFVYFTVVNNADAANLAYAGRVQPAFAPPTTPTATAMATATSTPVAQPTSTPRAAPAMPRDTRYFTETGYRVDHDEIWAYFQARGGIETFGFPVSRTFTFLGCSVQIFQRQVAQRCAGGPGVQLLNLLDPEIFPYTRVNGSVFPGPDEGLKNSTPRVGDPNYDTAILDFVRANAPDTFEGQPVNFGQTFFSSVSAQQAGTDNPGIIGLFDLEVWGAPISRPARDPSNSNFIYQRFQRGIMHFIAGQGTRGILLADYLKAIIMNNANLPGDLREQAQGSTYYAQYCPGGERWLCRPADLPNSDLTFAFERG